MVSVHYSAILIKFVWFLFSEMESFDANIILDILLPMLRYRVQQLQRWVQCEQDVSSRMLL